MKIKRVTNPKIIKYLRPFFTEDGAFTRDIIAKELFEIMISAPNEIFVGIIYEESIICGLAITWLMDNREYIWLSQVYSRPGTDRKYGIKLLGMIKQWAIKEFNIHEIRFETERNPKAIERTWDFKTHAYIMNCKF